MTTENKFSVRGEGTTLTWTYPGDLTARKIIFVSKANRELTSARVIQRKNTVAGGGNTQLTVSYSATTGLSTIVALLQPSIISQLVAKDYPYDITSEHASDSDDHDIIIQGKHILQAGVQSPYDSSVVIGELMANKFIEFYVTDANTITEVSGKAFGWTSKPTASGTGGTFTIISADDEFIVGKTKIFPTNWDINWTAPTTAEFVITAHAGDYPFSFEVWV